MNLKRYFFLLVLVSFYCSTAQQNAITENGDEVILYEDGSWSYVNDSLDALNEIPINEKEYEKDKKSTFLVKSKKTNMGVYINPKIWSFSKGENNPDAEYEFKLKNKELYGMMITEKTPIEIEALTDIAYQNAKAALSQLKRNQIEYRNLNGFDVIFMQMEGIISGINVVYYGYYFSNDTGSVQLITYTSNLLYEEYKEEMEKLINGLVLVQN